jgi:hypothetical protein
MPPGRSRLGIRDETVAGAMDALADCDATAAHRRRPPWARGSASSTARSGVSPTDMLADSRAIDRADSSSRSPATSGAAATASRTSTSASSPD